MKRFVPVIIAITLLATAIIFFAGTGVKDNGLRFGLKELGPELTQKQYVGASYYYLPVVKHPLSKSELDEAGIQIMRCYANWGEIEKNGVERFRKDMLEFLCPEGVVCIVGIRSYNPNKMKEIESPSKAINKKLDRAPRNWKEWEDFCYKTAMALKDKYWFWIINNEPWHHFRGEPEDWAKTVAVAAKAIKRADPNALVFAGGLNFDSDAYPNFSNYHMRLINYLAPIGGKPKIDGFMIHIYMNFQEKYPTDKAFDDFVREHLYEFFKKRNCLWGVDEVNAPWRITKDIRGELRQQLKEKFLSGASLSSLKKITLKYLRKHNPNSLILPENRGNLEKAKVHYLDLIFHTCLKYKAKAVLWFALNTYYDKVPEIWTKTYPNGRSKGIIARDMQVFQRFMTSHLNFLWVDGKLTPAGKELKVIADSLSQAQANLPKTYR